MFRLKINYFEIFVYGFFCKISKLPILCLLNLNAKSRVSRNFITNFLFFQELIDDFEAKKKKPKKVKKKPAVVKSQPLEKEKITQFFKETKKSTQTVKTENAKDILTEKSQNVFTEKPINKHLNIGSQKPSSIPPKKPLNISSKYRDFNFQ